MSINQNHLGSGDNVAGNKEVHNYYSISVDDLTEVAEDLMYNILADNKEKAFNDIQTYQKLPNLPEEATRLFTILTDYINSFQDENTHFDHNKLMNAIRKTESIGLKELYQALHVRATYIQEGPEQAQLIYDLYRHDARYHLLAVYDNLFASNDELNNRYKNELLSLDNYLLINLAKGLWRFDRFEEASFTLSKISKEYISENVQYLQLASDYNALVKVPNLQSYPYLPAETAHKLKNIISSFLELLSTKDKLSIIELDLLIAMTNGFGPYLHSLLSQAVRFKDEITQKDSILGRWLEIIYSQKIPDLSREVIDKLHTGQDLDHNELSDCLTALKHGTLNIQVMEGWLDKSGAVIESDEMFTGFLKIFIPSFKSHKGIQDSLEYKALIDDFIKRYQNNLRSISAVYIMVLIDNLNNMNEIFQVSIHNILEKVSVDIAVDNELYLYYLKSLLQLSKFKTLQEEFNKISENEWTNSLYSLYATYLLGVGNYQDAIDIYQKFIDDANNLYFWHNYLFCCYKSSKGLALAKEEIKRVPKKLFSFKTMGFDFFIIQAGNFVDPYLIEHLLVELFVKSPNDYARILVRYSLSRLTNHCPMMLGDSDSYKGIHQGLVYQVNGKRKQGLLVESSLAKSKDLIDIEKPLGYLLSTMNEGDVNEVDFDEIKLIERQQVSTTVFQLALHIVQESQHNYKDRVFHIFEVSEASAYEDVVNIMQKFNRLDNTEDFINNPEISLYLKGKHIGGQEVSNTEFETAHRLLLNPFANKCLTVSGGNSTVSEAMVVDIYGFIYLCLTNLYKSILASKITVYITTETASAIDLWLSDITRDDYLRVSEQDGQLRMVNADFVSFELGDLIERVRKLKKCSVVQTPKVYDLPTIVTYMGDLISNSIASSIKLSVANDIPWLCLDSIIRNSLSNSEEFKVVNLTYFVKENFNHPFLSWDDRKNAMSLWAYTGLFSLYSYKDLLTLADNTDDLALLSKILMNTPLNFTNSKEAETLLGLILKKLSLKLIPNNLPLAQHLLIEKAIYACLTKGLEVLEFKTSEEKIAMLAFCIIVNPPRGLEVTTIRAFNIIDKYARGHFMNIDAINQSLNHHFSNYQK